MARKQRERRKATQSKVASDARSKSKSVNVSTSHSGRATKPRSIPIAQLSERSFSARDNALHVWRDMQRGLSLSRAARNNSVKVETARKYLGAALRQDRPGGRIYATKSHRLVSYLQIPVPGPDGHPILKKVVGSKEASEWGRFKRDVNKLLAGKRNALAEWHGKSIGGVKLVTASSTLKSWADKGQLPYALYRSLSGGAA